MVVGVTASPRVSRPPRGPSGVTQRSSSWIASSGTPHSLGSGSWVHQVASLRGISAPWNRKNHGAGRVEPEIPPNTTTGLPDCPPSHLRLPFPAQLLLGNCQKGQLHIHASLGTGLHEGNTILLPGGEHILRACFWPFSPFTQPQWQSLTLANVSPSSERITLSLLTSACQAHMGQSTSGEGRLHPGKSIFRPRSKHYLPSSGSLRDCRQV